MKSPVGDLAYPSTPQQIRNLRSVGINNMRALFIAILLTAVGNTATGAEPTCAPSFNQEARKLRSSERINLCDAYAGKPLVVVNTISRFRTASAEYSDGELPR